VKSLSGAHRTFLRGLAHSLNPVIQVGKNGITPELIKAVDEALGSHELIKIKFMEFKDEKKELAAQIGEKTMSENVGMIGNIAIFYREQPDREKRRITLPK